MQDVPPTPIETLEKLAEVAIREGLKHVYLGNIWGHPLEHTYCPNCSELVVKRSGFYIVEWKLTNDFKCPRCGYKLNFRGKYWGGTRRFLII